MRLRQYLTSTARTRIHVSQGVVQTQLLRVVGVAATSIMMRLTRGCGMDVASLGGLTIRKTSDRQDAASKALDKSGNETSEGSNGDCASLETKCECEHEYVLVQHQYILVCTGLCKALLES